jgi:hypothetical protein
MIVLQGSRFLFMRSILDGIEKSPFCPLSVIPAHAESQAF